MHYLLLFFMAPFLQEATPPPPPDAQESASQMPEISLEGLLSRHRQARGGLEAFSILDSLRIESILSSEQGSDTREILYIQYPNKVMQENDFGHAQQMISYNGQKPKLVTFQEGQPSAVRDAAPFVVPYLLSEADLRTPLMDPAVEKAGQLKVVPNGAVGAYVIQYQVPDQLPIFYLIDPKSWLLVGFVSFEGPNRVEKHTIFEAYQPVAGMMMPKQVRYVKKDGTLLARKQIDLIDINPELPSDHFDLERFAQ